MTATAFFSSNSLAFSLLSIIYSIFRIEFLPNKFYIITNITVQRNIEQKLRFNGILYYNSMLLIMK
jgi:hypothetical protein